MDLPPLPRFSTSDCIAVAAAALAAWAAWTSRQALTISRRQEQRRLSPLDLYLANACIYRVGEERRRIYVFQIVVTNSADVPNSLRSAELQVRYVRDGRPGPLLSVPHSAEAAADIPSAGPVLTVPSSIAARGVLAGAITFNVPGEIVAGVDVESYRLSVSDALGRVSDVEAILLQERDHAE